MILALLVFVQLASAQIASECSSGEEQVFRHPEVLSSVVKDSRFLAMDCVGLPANRLGVLVTVNTQAGVGTYFSVFDRKNFTVKSRPIYITPELGMDAFPMKIDGKLRLIVAAPGGTMTRTDLYMRLQTGPANTRLARWVLNMKKNTISPLLYKAQYVHAINMVELKPAKGGYQIVIDGKTKEL